MSPSLRTPIANDYITIADWIPDATACARWAGPRLPFPFTATDLPSLLAVRGGDERSYSLIDESANLCGFGQHWVWKPGAVHLGRIIVAPGVRGRGMGRVLCQQLIAAALRSTSADAVTLRVYRDNPAAVRLYSSLGFSEVDAESDGEVMFMRMIGSSPIRLP